MVQAGVYAMLLTQTLDAFVGNAVLPALPYYVIAKLDPNDGAEATWHISLCCSAGAFATMVASPILGGISDRIGRKKTLLAALIFQAICNTYQSFASTVLMLVVARALVGVAMASGPVGMVYILEYVEGEAELNHVLAVQKIVCSLGALSGPLLVQFFPPDQFQLLCYALVAVNLVNFVIGLIFWKNAPPKVTEKGATETVVDPHEMCNTQALASQHDMRSTWGSRSSFGSLLSKPEESVWAPAMQTIAPAQITEQQVAKTASNAIIGNRATVTLLFISAINTFAFCVSDGNNPVYYQNYFAFQQSDFCYYMMAVQAASLVWSPIVPYIIARIGDQNSCIVATFSQSILILNLIWLAGVWWAPYLHAIVFQGLMGTLCGFGYLNILQKRLDKDMMGIFFGMSNSMTSIGGAIAPLVGGRLFKFNNFAPYAISTFLFFVVGCIYTSLPRWKANDAPLAEPLLQKTGNLSAGSLTSMVQPPYMGGMAKLAHVDLELYAAHNKQLEIVKGRVSGMLGSATVGGHMDRLSSRFSFQGLAAVGESSPSKSSPHLPSMEM
jgi:MFS family permease